MHHNETVYAFGRLKKTNYPMRNKDDYKPVNLLEAVTEPDVYTLLCAGHICPYCQKPSKLIDSKEIYGKSYGMMYACKKCDAYVGCHWGTEISKGRLANKQLRYWKKKAHELFDFMWRKKIKYHGCSKHEARTAAYGWLSEQMQVDKLFCHIGMFNEEQCKEVIRLCKPYYNSNQFAVAK